MAVFKSIIMVRGYDENQDSKEMENRTAINATPAY